MTGVMAFLRSEACARLVAVLLHSLWQGTALAVALWVVLRFLPAASVRARYLLSLAFLFVLPLAIAGTWSVVSPETSHANIPEARVAEASAGVPALAPVPRTARAVASAPVATAPRHNWTAAVAAVWFAGALLMLVRVAVSLTGAQRLRRLCRPAEDAAVLQVLAELCQRLGLRRGVHLLVGAVPGPAAIGLLWPAVLLPVELVSGMSPGQLSLILAHELAHIRRHDYLVNLLQLILEALLFFNPAVYWLSRQVRREREAACDALAVSVTGSPGDYARALAAYAVRAQGAALVTFSGSQDGPLPERVRRLLSGGYHPCSRLPLLTLAGAFVAGLICLGLLCAGTSIAVAQVLTPQARMQILEQARETHGQSVAGVSDERKVRVAGAVRLDGEPQLPDMMSVLPRGTVNILSTSGHSSYQATVDFRDGTFAYSVPPGTITVLADVEAYAPACAGPRVVGADESWEDVDLVLRRGFDASARVTDEQGRPIPGARVFASSVVGSTECQRREFESEADGTVSLTHLNGDLPVRLKVLASGYQHMTVEHTMRAREMLAVPLTPATASEGVVTDRATDQPVAGAEVLIVHANGPFQYPLWGSPDSPGFGAVADTDEQGRFALTSLRDDTTYSVFVRAEGHGPAFLYDVRAGRTDLRVALGPALYVKGKVVGALDALPQNRGRPYISYANPWRTSPDSTTESWHGVDLDVRDGVGYFEIADLWEGQVRITAGSRQQNLPLTAPIEDMVIDLTPSPPGAPAATRPLVIRLMAPQGAAPTGTVQLVISPPEPGSVGEGKVVALDGSQVRIEVRAPSRLLLRPESTVGYWFEMQQKECPAGEGELVWDVPVRPAGAFVGQVLDADGQPVPDANVSLVMVRHPPDREQSPRPDNVSTGPDGRFMLTPIAYGMTYGLVAWRNAQFAVSEEMTLNGATPLRDVQLQFARGVTIRGRVELPDGAPAEFVPVQFGYSSPWSHSFGMSDVHADRFGAFDIRDVNPDLPGKYYVSVTMPRLYRLLHRDVKPGKGDLVLRLERGETLKGTVVDFDTGRPLAGLRVFASRSEPFDHVEADAPTDERGEFEFTRLGNGEYALMVPQSQVVGRVPVTGGGFQEVGEAKAVAGRDAPVTIRARTRQ